MTDEFEHEFPEDDFQHKESIDCECKPFKQWDFGRGTRVVHHEIVAEEINWEEHCHSFPEEWLKIC